MNKMRKVVFVLPVLFLLASCTTTMVKPEPKRAAATPELAINTPLPPTVDLQGTIEALQSTQTWATAEAEQRSQENIMLTARADSWTATAALTAVPATHTQQAISNTQIAADITLAANRATWTAVYPTQILTVANAKAQAQTALLHQIASDISMPLGWLFAIVLVGSLTIVIVKRDPPPLPAAAPQAQPAPARRFISKAPTSNGLGTYITPPGNLAHFTEFALTVRSGKKGFAKTEWEKADSPYNRQTYGVVYNWMWKNDFLRLKPGGNIELTTDGERWLDQWIEQSYLTSPIEESSIYPENPALSAQPSENQPPESGGGVGKTTKGPKKDGLDA